ncbi:MAG: hypothetical protein KGJ62_05110 [Armatimonadetes bacterium]|nr:hypothetical protein [Armatimonadota bacterium]MDE2205441.1 hypothetical protein [Armatimonadota bacterium]
MSVAGLRVIVQPGATPSWNMAMDEALFDSACESGAAVLRLYTWPAPAVTIGFTQWREPNSWPVAPSTPIVRRITGGRGILHGNDVTLSLSLPANVLSRFAVPRRPMAIYQWLMPAFVDAFKELEVCAATGTHTARAAGAKADCFATALAGDLVDRSTGAKVLGAAVRIRQSGALLQATIPYCREWSELAAIRSCILGARPDSRPALECRSEELVSAIQHTISRLIQEPCVAEPARQHELARAETLANIYASPNWNRTGQRPTDTG